ncbi:Cytochrome P450 4V2 [Araneus ventricosus]|uniref:Cytochrome P450 4V2 n=1 Tax=Araneus ventricosus TaxID=182803 RepID=A0A4Y2EVD3_ARAVE|nr:Cytochrome P450 4V2 [Araneus ventricosus]
MLSSVLIVTIAILIGMFMVVMNYLCWRRKFSRLMPGKQPGFFNPLGNLSELPLSEKSRNGHSVNVFLLQMLGGFSKLFEKQKLFCIWFFCSPVIILTKAEAVEAILSDPKIIEKSWFYSWLRPVVGYGLVTSGNGKWRSRRRLLNPCFHSEILRDFVVVMNKQARVLIKRLQEETSKDSTDIVVPLSLCALDVICETILGVSISAQERAVNEFSQFVESVHRGMELIVERMGNCLHWSDFIYSFTANGKEMKKYIKIGEDFTRSVIQEKREKYLRGDMKIGESKRSSLMDVLMEHHLQTKDFSEEDIREELITFLVAGHDTTATSITWALYLIGLHPDVQAKIHKELDLVFGDDLERPVTVDDFKNLKYLERVFKESDRLYPAAPFFARDLSDDANICGYSIPKGSTCLVLAYYLHRDEDVFPNAEIFDPDRFLPENSANRHHYSYVPFSAGLRNCIGQRFAIMETKVIVSSLLRQFTIESLDPRDAVLPSLKIHLKPSGPVRLRIRPRYSKAL